KRSGDRRLKRAVSVNSLFPAVRRAPWVNSPGPEFALEVRFDSGEFFGRVDRLEMIVRGEHREHLREIIFVVSPKKDASARPQSTPQNFREALVDEPVLPMLPLRPR